MLRRKIAKLALTTGVLAAISAIRVMAAGWTTNAKGDQVYVQDTGNVVTNSWIKANDGGSVIWYYATQDGTLRKGGWQTVNGNKYYFDENGVMQTGWIDEYKYYCDPNSGAAVTGWKYIPIPDDFAYYYSDNANFSAGSYAWFFFNTSNSQKYFADGENVAVKTINGIKYGFDENGVMQLGWAKVKDTSPEIAGYMFFAEKTDGNFKQGQQISGTWYTTVGPLESSGSGSFDKDLATGDVEYFYFKPSGYVAAGNSNAYQVCTVNNKRYLFNEKGNPVYGMQLGCTENDSTTHYYYCGSSKSDCSVKTGRFSMTEADGDRITFYAQTNGRGYTGVKDGYLYYNGKLQCADSDSKYMVCNVEGKDYVISTSGSVQKSKKNLKDSDGNKVSTNGDGTLKENIEGSFAVLEATSPDIDDID
ncbi:MAG: cell wall-binding protein [Oribacterium sp.]|nr:cell wall-binding protein [Oribacterium sp.]